MAAVKTGENGTLLNTLTETIYPSKDFAAIMACSHADENCPVVFGTSKRVAITYDDPKDFDATPLLDEKYIGTSDADRREMLYAFSQLRG